MIELNREELAWAAGFFDGEGTISRTRIAKGKSANGSITCPQLGVAQCDIRPLNRFLAAVGYVGGVYGPYKPPHAGQQERFVWQANKFEYTQAVAAMLWQFLSEPKKAQITKALNEYKDLRARRISARKARILPDV